IERGFNGTSAVAHADGTPINSANVPDIFAVPTPLPLNGNSPLTGVAFTGPYDTQTLPLIIPGPHVVQTSIPNVVVQATFLNGEISDFDSTFNVTSSNGFPSNSFAAKIGNEQIWVDSINGNTWTVERGQNHTTATAHADGSTVTAGDTSDNLVLNSTVS